MAWKLANTWQRLSLLQSAAAGDTTLYVSTAHGALLPTLGASDQAPLVLFDDANREIVYITAISGGTLTVTRGQEGTTARAWPAGTIAVHTPTAEALQTAINASTTVVFAGTATNVGDAYTLNVGAGNPVPSLAEGEEVIFHVPSDNTGAATLVVTNGSSTTAVKALQLQEHLALEAGDLQQHWYVRAIYSSSHDAWVITQLSSFQLRATHLNNGSVPAVNRHRNGRLDFWNNGTSFSTPASGTETADGWLAEYDGTIGTFTVNRQDFTLGQTEVEGDPKHFIRWDHSAAGSGSTFRRFKVKLPGVHWRNGEQVTRRLWLKADSARTVTGKIIQHFGTGGGPSADVEVSSQAYSVTTSWQAFSTSPTLASISGKTLGSGADDALWLSLELPLNVTMTIDAANDDIRPGSLGGLQSDTFPVPWWLGGTGGSWDNGPDFFVDQFIGNLASISTALSNYVADPLSVAELASITAAFGTAAFKNLGTSGDTVAQPNGANTWSALQTFSADLLLSSTAPRARLSESDQAADEKAWDFAVTGGDLLVRTRTDADGAGVTALTFDRGTGTAVTSVTVGASQLLVPAGSAASPGVAGSGDTNTGIELPGTDDFYMNTAGTRRWRITSAGHLQPAADGPTIAGSNGTAGAPSYRWLSESTSGRYRIGSNNFGESVSSTLVFDWNATRLQFGSGFDGVLPTTAHAPTSTHSIGYRGAPTDGVNGNTAYAFPAADAGHTVYHDEAGTRTYTIPANASVAHPVGTMFIIDNTGNSGAAGAITLAITSDTLRRGDGTAGTGSRTIPASAVAVIRKVASTIWVITGIFS